MDSPSSAPNSSFVQEMPLLAEATRGGGAREVWNLELEPYLVIETLGDYGGRGKEEIIISKSVLLKRKRLNSA